MALNPTKPKEVICLYPMELPTAKGDVYFFMAVDVVSHFVFQLGMEKQNNEDSLLKNIQKLMDNKDFNIHKEQPFTLVLHKYEHLRPKIEAIIQPHKGSLVIDDPYLTQHVAPVMAHIVKNLSQQH